MRALRTVVSCAALGLAAARAGVWKPEVEGVAQLDAVEQALKRVSSVALDSRQQKLANSVVRDVNQALADVRGNSNLTKAEKQARVKTAIDRLQGLQSQWELASVETSLQTLLSKPLSPKALTEAKGVAEAVTAVVKEVEGGKLTGEQQRAKVGSAVQKLQVLAQHLESGSKVTQLERQLAEKKAMLEKDEKELQLAKLQKELLEKKAQLRGLEADRQEAEARQVQRQEDSAEQAQISKLVSFAKELVAAKAIANEPATPVSSKPNATKVAAKPVPPQVSAILADLSARAQNVSAALAKMDADEKVREEESQKRVREAMSAPVKSKSDPMSRAAEMLGQLAKRRRRNFLKARALKVTELKELTDGIQKIKNGDLKVLSALLGQMEHESKNLQAKTKGFLY